MKKNRSHSVAEPMGGSFPLTLGPISPLYNAVESFGRREVRCIAKDSTWDEGGSREP